MNKKQLIVTSILLSLMLILAITQGFFTEHFEKMNLSETTMTNFKEYKFNEDKYLISFPNEWTIEQENNKGAFISDILKFKGTDDRINGILQVINTNEDIGVFTENDLKHQSLKYYDSKVTPFKGTENVGVLLRYNTSIKDGYEFKNECYYIKLDDNQIAKVLFNIKNDDYSDDVDNVCSKIISSIKQNK